MYYAGSSTQADYDDDHDEWIYEVEQETFRDFGPEEHLEIVSDNGVHSAKFTFKGAPKVLSHVVIGDSHITRVGYTNILDSQGYTEGIQGLVLISTNGGMHRFSQTAKEFARKLHGKYTDAFADRAHTVHIAICMGYNEVTHKIQDYYRHCIAVLEAMKHAFAHVEATVKIQLGEILFGKSSLHYVNYQRNFVHSELRKLLGQDIPPLRCWISQIGQGLPEKGLKSISVCNTNISIERDTMDQTEDVVWHHQTHIYENLRDVILAWTQGEVAGTEKYAPGFVYQNMQEYTISIPNQALVLGEDYFARRHTTLEQIYNRPLDDSLVSDLRALPLPVMRLEGFVLRTKPRPQSRDSSAASGGSSVFERLDGGRGGRSRGPPFTTVQRGDPRQRGNSGSVSHGRGRGGQQENDSSSGRGRGHRGRGAGQRGQDRYRPYSRDHRQNDGW